MATGRLFLIPTGLSDENAAIDYLPAPVIAQVRAIDTFVAENAKSARAFLASCGHPRTLREIAITELNEHTAAEAIGPMLDPARKGADQGLISEAGAPAVADPGARLVAAAHAEGIRVIPLVGPSSILLGLMASGLEGQRFRFHGYLPVAADARRERLVEIERDSAERDETQAFIETPYRNDALLAEILKSCRETTQLAVAADLTGPGETIRMQTIGGWRRHPGSIGKRPAIFMVLAAKRGGKR
jgi:16S rRNA (cytidine1402-2'-O)-methyltransferase